MRHPSSLRHAPLVLLALALHACTGSSGGSGEIGFQLTVISIDNDDVLKVNEEISFTFTEPIDFSTVSLNTINIQTDDGTPATGSFFVPVGNPSVVVFQPTCPTAADGDTGFQPGGETYILRVLGRSGGAVNTVRSQSGAFLGFTQERRFTTAQPDVQFLDKVPGAPAAIVRPKGSTDPNATYLDVGANGQRIYFERDATQNIVLSEPGFEAPLNLYADPATRISWVIEFNQPISPNPDNISPDKMRLEYQDGVLWFPLETAVTLEGNCTEAGASVRLTPLGPVPPDTMLRAVLFSGISDLTTEATSTTNSTFAFLPSRPIDFASLNPVDQQSDELDEPFDFGAASPFSLHDDEALTEIPMAIWGGGELKAAFDFSDVDPCAGGPTNTFDWVVSGQTVLDTNGGTIISADGTQVQAIEGSGPRAGMLDVRNWTITSGARLRVQGANPLRISATGTVQINGILDVSGFDAGDVEDLNSGNVREEGALGGPGGGRGGHTNEVLNTSTPRGGFGQGPLNEINDGGQGGETGFSGANTKDSRRPGGGAGGRFAQSILAESGFAGAATAVGAVTGQSPPTGGAVAPGPFVGTTDDDFFGTRPVGLPGNVTDLVRGELPSLWGGYGGGGGGNADPAGVFPTPNWTPSSDEKGGAGGGGGGAVHIRALGPIQFGPGGQIRSNGGRGGRGESILQQDFLGGSGGSGSGGHIMLESAATITNANCQAVGGARVVGADPRSAGGAGGPGVVQLHVPDPLGAPPVGVVSSPAAIVLQPFFSPVSKARSKWVTIGSADKRAGGVSTLLRFVFGGTNVAEGTVLDVDQDGIVDELDAIVDENLAGNGVIVNRLVLRLDDAPTLFSGALGGLQDDIYLRNPSLLQDFVLRLSVGATAHAFLVASAAYDDDLGQLSLTVADDGFDLLDFTSANPGPVHVALVPRFFQVRTCDQPDSLPEGSSVRILFQAAADDGTGQPDEANPLVDWTGDVSLFNSLPAGELQFFRFEVEFDLGVAGPDTQTVSLDFLRLPFVF